MGLLNISGFGTNKNNTLALALQGRTPEQQNVIRYFLAQGGCFGGGISFSDDEFDKLLSAKVRKIDVRGRGLEKLCVDESQIKDVDPIYLDGYYFDESDADIYIKTGRDGVTRCSKYQLSCIFFSSEQMYLYSYLFDLTNSKTTERTVEYFYKDITSVSISTKVKEKPVSGGGCIAGFTISKYITNEFLILSITVPGDSFVCSMRLEKEQSVTGMKNLIRERKQS